MSAIDTYTKYNLHSAAPYIDKGECPGMQKKQGEMSGGSVCGKCPTASLFIQQPFWFRFAFTL